MMIAKIMGGHNRIDRGCQYIERSHVFMIWFYTAHLKLSQFQPNQRYGISIYMFL